MSKTLYSDNHFVLSMYQNSSDTYYKARLAGDSLGINLDYFKNLKIFLDATDKLNLYPNEFKKYLIGKSGEEQPEIIITNDYIYNNLLELDDVYDSLKKIQNINKQKQNSKSLELKFTIGLIIINDINRIISIEKLKHENNIDYIVVVRNKIVGNCLLEYLVDNLKFINQHIYSLELLLYRELIEHDFIFTI